MKKKRIAVLIDGGIGTGHFGQGYPMLEKLLDGIAEEIDITVFSQWAASDSFQSTHFEFHAPSKQIRSRMLRWLTVFMLLIRHHRRKRFDHLVAFWGFPAGFLSTVLSKMLGIKGTICLMGGDATGIASINFGILHRRMLRPFALWGYRNADQLVALTSFQASQLRKFGIQREVIVITWGTVAGMFEFNLRKPLGQLHCLHVAHLTPVKDQTTLLKCFAAIVRNIPASLKIAGEDTMNGRIQQMAIEMGIDSHIIFLPMQPYNQMKELYTWADCLIHTSLYEGQSMAMTEAAASGVLLAGTNVGILHDLGKRCAIVVEPGDHAGLAEKIIELRKNELAWTEKIIAAYQWSKANDLSQTVRRFTRLFLPPE